MMNLARKSAYKGLDEAVVYFSEDKPKDKNLRQKNNGNSKKRVKFARHFRILREKYKI